MLDKYSDVVKLWQSYHIESPGDLDKALHNFRVLFAYHSGRIENECIEYHDTREIFENGKVTGFTGDPRALFEQQNQKLCYEYLKDKIVAREPLSLALVLEVHGILSAGTYDEHRYIARGERPGSFKRHDYVTGIHEVGSPPEEVESALAELLMEINEVDETSNIMLAAAYFHARFEYIHPFADGNGRVGRTLMNHFLMTRDRPPLVIYDEDKKQYYAALECYDTDEDIRPLRDFLETQAVKTWEKTLARLNEASQNRKTLKDLEY